MEHVIETEGQSLYVSPCHLDQVKLTPVQADFQKIETACIFHHSKSPWASPLHMVSKPFGSWLP